MVEVARNDVEKPQAQDPVEIIYNAKLVWSIEWPV